MSSANGPTQPKEQIPESKQDIPQNEGEQIPEDEELDEQTIKDMEEADKIIAKLLSVKG